LYNKTGDNFYDQFIDIFNKNDVGRLGYSAGFNIGYKLSNRWGLDLGIHYSRKGYGSKKYEITDPRLGYAYSSNSEDFPLKVRSIYSINYLDLPFRFIHVFEEAKNRWFYSAGINTSIYLHSSNLSIVHFANGQNERNRSNGLYFYNEVCFSPVINAGVEHAILPELIMRIEPTFQYAINPIFKSPLETRLWSAGLNLSCYYKFQ
jgi:hypothetical protein